MIKYLLTFLILSTSCYAQEWKTPEPNENWAVKATFCKSINECETSKPGRLCHAETKCVEEELPFKAYNQISCEMMKWQEVQKKSLDWGFDSWRSISECYVPETRS